MSDYLRMENARTPEQQELMARIKEDGVCPFCAEYFTTYHPKPILKETPYWFFTENMSPYTGTKHHFIFVYKPEHITSITDVSEEGMSDLFKLVKEAATEYAMPGCSFFIRFGDNRYNGSSVAHLHAQLLMGDVDDPEHQSVKVKLG